MTGSSRSSTMESMKYCARALAPASISIPGMLLLLTILSLLIGCNNDEDGMLVLLVLLLLLLLFIYINIRDTYKYKRHFNLISRLSDIYIYTTFTPRDIELYIYCLLYTSDAADERSSVDLGGRRIIKK